MRYNIIDEIHHGKNYYYVRDNEDVYVAKPELSLPYHPIISYKKFNYSSYYDKVEDSKLVEIILKEYVNEIKRR